MKTRLQTSLGQQLVLTPQLQQAIKLLQMSTTELELEIAQAVESNPLLDWSDSSDEGAGVDKDGSGEDAAATMTPRPTTLKAAATTGRLPSWTGAVAAAAVVSMTTTTMAVPPNALPKPKPWPTTCCGSCT